MQRSLLIGLAAGLASAALFASATAGHPVGRLLIFFLAPLPAFLAGLGWGTLAAAVSTVAATAGAAALLGWRSALVVLLSQGLPVTALCHLAQLGRPAPLHNGQAGVAAVEWYPVGRMIAWSVAMAGIIAFGTMLLLAPDLDSMRKLLRELIEKLFLQQLPGLKDRKLTDEEIAALTEVTLYAFPATTAVSWLGGLLLNFYLSGRITLASGRLPRPWPDLAAITYPRGFGLGLALSLAIVTLSTGYPALLASGFAGAFFLAYLFLGLAIIHYVTRGKPARPLILASTYLTFFLLNTWAGLAIALLAVLEPVLPWRRWKKPPNPPPD